MKALILALSLLIATPAMATAIKPCNTKGLKYLKDLVEERAADGPSTALYMVNKNNETVGVYVWDHDGSGVSAEICEIIEVEDDFITASEWYYWENDDVSSNPATWTLQSEHSIAQDEGRAYLKTLSKDANGDLTVEFKVIGWGEIDEEIVFRSDILRLVK